MENFIVFAMKDVDSNMNHDFGFIRKYNFWWNIQLKKKLHLIPKYSNKNERSELINS